MPSQGPNFPSSGTDQGGGTDSWTNPGNITADDGNYATVALISPGDDSNILRGTGFGFIVPSSSIINGILLEIKRGGGACLDEHVRILKAGVEVGTDKASATSWVGAVVYVPYGGSSDLWGTTWLPSDINNASFGADMQVISTSGGGLTTPEVDAYRITVYYTITTQFSGVITTDA